MYVLRVKEGGRWIAVRDVNSWPLPRLFAYAGWAVKYAKEYRPEAEMIAVDRVKLSVEKKGKPVPRRRLLK